MGDTGGGYIGFSARDSSDPESSGREILQAGADSERP